MESAKPLSVSPGRLERDNPESGDGLVSFYLRRGADSMKTSNNSRTWQWLVGVIALTALVIVACGGSATATRPAATAVAPAATAVPVKPANTLAAATVAPSATSTPVPTPVATVAPAPTAVTAKDSIVLVLPEESDTLDSLGAASGIVSAIHIDNLSDPLTWQSGDDQRIVPTTASTGWEQLAPDKWRFELRQGVKFHNGEDFNAQAAFPSADFLSNADTESNSYGYTGGFTPEVVGDFTMDFNCDAPCPVFPNTTFFLNFTAPEFLATHSESERSRQNMSLGPYKQVAWNSGVSITIEVFDDYTPAGDHFEFQNGVIRDVTFLFRGEPQVMMAMIQTGEADLAWDVGVDAVDVLDTDQLMSGGSAETFSMDLLSIWGGETSKQKVRLAMNHAINCQEIIDALYGGNSVCRGNIIWPGVIGATEENTAPYEYNPALARQLLEEADYDFDTTLTLFSRGTRIPKQVEVVEAYQSYLAEVGINVDITIGDVAQFVEARNCRSGRAVADLLASRGRDVDPSEATLEEMQAAMEVATQNGSASCPTYDIYGNEPSNETLDFGRQAIYYLNCARIQSPNCDPSPGGIQEKIGPANSANGEERVRLLTELADYVHEQSLWLSPFDLPVFYAVNPKLVWEPRFDRRVRINAMRFSN